MAGAFQLTGFLHVIWTMWKSDNIAATEVARIFYLQLIKTMDPSPKRVVTMLSLMHCTTRLRH